MGGPKCLAVMYVSTDVASHAQADGLETLVYTVYTGMLNIS